jgi:hypothetical protein
MSGRTRGLGYLPVITIFTGELMLLCFESSGRAWI